VRDEGAFTDSQAIGRSQAADWPLTGIIVKLYPNSREYESAIDNSKKPSAAYAVEDRLQTK
jgi:hypothetical protein